MHLVLAALALLTAAPKAHALPPGSYQLASLPLTGGGLATPGSGGGGGGGATDGQLDFSAASQSGLLAFF